MVDRVLRFGLSSCGGLSSEGGTSFGRTISGVGMAMECWTSDKWWLSCVVKCCRPPASFACRCVQDRAFRCGPKEHVRTWHEENDLR